MLSARTNTTNETRKVGQQSGGDGAVPSQVETRYECAFTLYEHDFPEEPDRRARVDANDLDAASDMGGALNDIRDRARFCRTKATCIWGVSDPRFSGRRTSTGGWQRGSLTPRLSLHCGRQRADCDTGGTERRRRGRTKPPHCEGPRRPVAPSAWMDLGAHALVNSVSGGEHCSRVNVPPL